MIKILIADDHAIVRAGLRQFIADDAEMEVVGEVSNGAEAIEMVRTENPSVVLLDISMPSHNGIDALSQIKMMRPHLPVLILSGYAESQYAVPMIKAGADGYLNKESAPEELLRAIRTLSQGRRYISSSVAEKLLDSITDNTVGAAHERLSERELQIFLKLAQGESLTGIAERLSLSVKTISTYRSRILEKMKFSGNADMTSYAIKNGLID